MLCADAHRLYLSATPDVRRQLNQAVSTRFWIIDDQVQGADLTTPFAQLLVPDLTDRLAVESNAAKNLLTGPSDDLTGPPEGQETPGGTQPHTGHLVACSHPGAGKCLAQGTVEGPHGPLPWEAPNPDLHSSDQGSNIGTLVELRGIEPLTSSMPWKRSTN